MSNLINKIFSNFCNLNIIQKIIILVISSLFLLLFVQNFIFSSSFDILMFRSVDDFAFQKVLRSGHEDIIYFKIDKLFKLYAYGYGWLFWITHIIITFPFYLIALLGSDFLLISMSRNISLFFMIGSCFFLFKSIKIYTKDKYIPFISILLFVSYPYFAFSALSFRTIAQASFFCILTFYLVIRNSILSKKDLKYVALSFAACLGTKLSTALFAPLVAIMLIDRFGFKINKNNFKNALYFLKYFIPSAIFFINPSLFVAPFSWHLFTKYRGVMSYYFQNVQNNHGSGGDFLENFINAFRSDFLNQYVLTAFLLMFFIKIIFDIRNKKQNKFDNLYILTFLVFVSIYLCFRIKMGATYITNYFFSFSFLILFPITVLNIVNNFVKYTVLTLLVTINITLNFDNIKNSYLHYQDKYYSENVQRSLNSQNELQKLLGDQDQKLKLLIDYRAPVIYSNFRDNIDTISIFDNVSVVEKWSQSEFDYILLHNDSRMMIDEKDFKNLSVNADPKLKTIWIESRRIIKSLMNTGQFRESKYKIIYNKNKLILFKRI